MELPDLSTLSLDPGVPTGLHYYWNQDNVAKGIESSYLAGRISYKDAMAKLNELLANVNSLGSAAPFDRDRREALKGAIGYSIWEVNNAKGKRTAGAAPQPAPAASAADEPMMDEATLRKEAKKLQEKALKRDFGVIVQLPGADPIEPKRKGQVVLRRSATTRWQAVKKLFANHAKHVTGKDLKDAGYHNTLEPIAAFDIYYGDGSSEKKSRKDMYLAQRDLMRIEKDCREYGNSKHECVRTDQVIAHVAKDATQEMPELDASINEKLLMHGTAAATVPLILAAGFNRMMGKEGADYPGLFGPGNYMAEDVAKTNHYVKHEGYQLFNARLGLFNQPKTYYVLVVRTLLGCATHVANPSGGHVNDTVDMKGRRVYGRTKLLLLGGPGYNRPMYDSVIVEHGSTLRGPPSSGGKFREFLVQNNERILPIMLVAYKRKTTKREGFNPKALDC